MTFDVVDSVVGVGYGFVIERDKPMRNLIPVHIAIEHNHHAWHVAACSADFGNGFTRLIPPTRTLVKWRNADLFVRATLSTMSNWMQGGSPSIRSTAALLGLHVRTLQRHLRDWGTTFEQLLDDARRERALSLLQSGASTITETAFLLGYSDAAHFTRAFRRWTGVSPRAYAKAQSKEIRRRSSARGASR